MTMGLARHLPKGFTRSLADLAAWEIDALERIADRAGPYEKRSPILEGEYWAVAQTVTKMEHLVRREIEKTNHGAFLPTMARFSKVDGRDYVKERPVFGGYVFFLTHPDDWAGIPDIHGVYDVLATADNTPKRVSDEEMARMVIGHAAGLHNETAAPRYTKYFRGERPKQVKKRRRPKPGRRIRNYSAP